MGRVGSGSRAARWHSWGCAEEVAILSQEWMDRILERIQSRAGVKMVYGDPVSAGDTAIIPVARVLYGFGGGSGHGPAGEDGQPVGAGMGLGGGVMATPVGVVEVSPAGTRFIPLRSWPKLGAALALGLALGLGIGKRIGRRRAAQAHRGR